MVYNSQRSFVKFKDIDEVNELSLDSMYKKLNNFQKRFNRLKSVNPQTDNNEFLKQKVLVNVIDLFNEQLLHLQWEIQWRKRWFKCKKQKFDYKKLRLTDGCQYESEE